jgi:sugar lactone lactonase YvrE
MAGKRSERVWAPIVATVAMALGVAAAPAVAADVRVTQGTNLAVAPAPDGSIVMDLQGTLWRVPPAGGAATRLTGDEVEPALPVVTPDGRRVIFQDYSDGNFHIWSMSADGSDRRRLTDGTVRRPRARGLARRPSRRLLLGPQRHVRHLGAGPRQRRGPPVG